ncbi:cytochrome c oxidase assembly protein [Wenxinia marina]|uniref:Cytochrome c oxidase assembly protein CtaG n=1 Tax=Wenxinia marina DSM 24838 TaxID=1123501 RepID=A0A0D0NHY8_9RHOB|nr:cytochrome c oxidase assembly protein [Wenxinia marina]KIQ67955.1 Cytochrome oxidase assembly factor [Wenxinia marina DSM 24838]GGL75926.1 cytochrome c oxidase assembly protein CtaG [Wenxinia marina]
MNPYRRIKDPNTRVAAMAVSVVLVMGALAWAAVPFYSWFCRVTGFGGATNVAEAASDTILDRTITVRFDANTDPDMPWEFLPMQREMTLRIGETGLAFYEASNPTDRPVAGQASFNVAPYAAGGYFDKIECFCFTEQVLQPGETVEMPVSFFVDPAIVDDREAKYVHEIVLSYTFYEIDLPEDESEQAALSPQALTGADAPSIDTN